jgi:3-keto-disaccharide hydrolase
MTIPTRRVVALGIASAALVTLAMHDANAQPSTRWPIHSLDRPTPPVVKPPASTWSVAPPGDATVLFGGSDLGHWQKENDGGAAGWKVENGYVEVVPGAGGIASRDKFGDAQLHIEWMTPLPAVGESQERGNSGVFLMGRYEVQVLDSYENRTYADGQASAVYGQYPPLVNVSRPPGEWQSYDIVFHRPRFDAAGKVTSPARMTVLHNGVLVQDNVVLSGPTAHQRRPPYEKHDDRLPMSLQDHGTKVRYRNIWIRDMEQH